MSRRTGLLAEVSWLQVAVSALAAVTAAWIASSLGVAGTLIGAALGSTVVTVSSAFYGRTLDKGKTLIVQTASGTVVQKSVDDGEIAEAFDEIQDADGSPVASARIVVDDEPRGLHWKTIAATTALVLGISIAGMGTYELITGNSYGAASGNARIGNPLGGSDVRPDRLEESPDPEPSSTTSAPTPTPRPTATTPSPMASETPQPTAPASPTPTPTTSPSQSPTATPSTAVP